MNFRKRQSALPQFQMTAMMDIVFLLLCFFVTSTVFSQWEYTMDIQLPTAASGEIAAGMSSEIKLNITREGIVMVNQKTYAGEELDAFLKRIAEYLPDQTVIIRADAETPHKEFIKVVDACKLVGIRNLSLASLEKSSSEGLTEGIESLPPPPVE